MHIFYVCLYMYRYIATPRTYRRGREDAGIVLLLGVSVYLARHVHPQFMGVNVLLMCREIESCYGQSDVRKQVSQ